MSAPKVDYPKVDSDFFKLSLDGTVGFLNREQQEGITAYPVIKINMELMSGAFRKFEKLSPTVGQMLLADEAMENAVKILIEIIHRRAIPVTASVEDLAKAVKFASSMDVGLNMGYWVLVQDALIRFIEPDMPGAYIRDSACYLQYLYAADQLTLNDSTFPSQPLWYDLLANIKLNDENRITTARGIPMFTDGIPMALYNRIIGARKHVIKNSIDQARRYLLRNEGNRMAVIAAHVNISGVFGVGFVNFNTNPTETDLDNETIAEFVKKLEDGAEHQKGGNGDIYRHMKDVVVRKLMTKGDGPAWRPADSSLF